VSLFPLEPTLTFEKVVMDHDEGITHLIRGMDLLSEYSLYEFYCRYLKISRPKHTYLPRLRWHGGSMSKSRGARTIGELRSMGFSPEEVCDMVKQACLHWHVDGWIFNNIKGVPSL